MSNHSWFVLCALAHQNSASAPLPTQAGNCHAFMGGDVDIVSQLDAAGTTWRVHALRTDDGGRRAAVLSGAAAPTLHEAFEELHRKSAQAVDRYVAANGLDAVPEPVSARRRRAGRKGPGRGSSAGGSDSERSLVSSSTLTASSESGSESDSASSGGEGVVDLYTRLGRKQPMDKAGRKQPMDKARAKKLPGFDSSKPRESAHHGALQPSRDTSLPLRPVRANKTGPQPPVGHTGVIPPRGWPGARLPSMEKTVGVGERGRGNSKMKVPGSLPPPPPMFKAPGPRPMIHHASTPMPMPMPMPRVPPPPMTTAPAERSIILTVDWAGHGQATFADECELSAAAVRHKTRTLLARRLGDFTNVSPHHFSAGEVEVRRVRVDGHVFVVTGSDHDCLAMVMASVGPAPRVVHVFVHVAADHDDG